MTIPITILGSTVLWPTQGDTDYANATTKFAQLVSTAVAPISGLYNNTTAHVGNLAINNSDQLTFNGAVVLTGSGGGFVESFNTRTGAVTLTSSDVTTALGFTPGTGTVTSISVNGTAGNITSSGSPITSSGTITLDLVPTAVTPGSYTNANVTVDSFGRITAASNGTNGTVTSVAASGSNGVTISGSPITTSGTISIGLGAITPTSVAATGTVTGSNLSGTNTGDQTITLTGDVTGSGTGSFVTTLANTAVTPGSYTLSNLTIDSKGRVTAAANGTSSNIITALGYTPAHAGANSDITSLSGITGGISTTDYVTFDTGITPSVAVGKLQWDPTYGTLQVGLQGGNVNLQIGQETNLLALNKTGSNFIDGQIVRVTGAQGNRPTVALAQSNTNANCAGTIGMVTEPILNNQQGYVTTYGLVNDLNTSAFTDGDTLYLSATTPGAITNVQPASPNYVVVIGYVVRAHATNGTVLVSVHFGAADLNDLADVDVISPTNGQVLTYDSGAGYWKNAAPATSGTVTSVTVNGTAGRITSSGSPITSSGTITLDLATTAVTPGSYSAANITVDAYGRITAAATGSAGGGTVTSVSVVSANGFAGTVASPSSTPAITISTSVAGVLKGNGTAISAATSGTDYSAGTSALATGILKSTTGTGALSIAVAGDFPTLNQNTTGTAALATALAGGAASNIVYQSGSGTTAFLANGTAGQILQSNGASAPSWVAAPTSGLTNVTVSGTTQTATSGNQYVLTNVATTTVTLPASPAANDKVGVKPANGLYTNVIDPNGATIEGVSGNLTIDNPFSCVVLQYLNSSWRFV